MKIAYIVSLFPCLSETFILREIEELKNLGYDITIFSLKRDRQEDLNHKSARKFKKCYSLSQDFIILQGFITSDQIILSLKNIFKYNKSNLLYLLKSFYIIPIVMEYADIMQKLEVKHLHAHWATIPTSAAWMINKVTKIPYSFTAHAWDIWKNNEMLPLKIQDAKFVATISDFNKKLLSKDLKRKDIEKINIVHCGIDVEKFNYIEPKPYKKLKIISVGRFVEKKGFIYLAEACHNLLNLKIDFDCTIIGNGPLWEEIDEWVKKLKLDNHIDLAGAMPQEKLQEKFRNSDLFVLPAVKASNGDLDGIPVVLMEAMALGIPVISTSVSGIPELIEHEESGLLINEKNVNELTDAIKQFLKYSNTNILLAKMGRKKIEQEFNIKKSALQMSELIGFKND